MIGWIRKNWIYFLVSFVVFGTIAYFFRRLPPTEQARTVLSVEAGQSLISSPLPSGKPEGAKEKIP